MLHQFTKVSIFALFITFSIFSHSAKAQSELGLNLAYGSLPEDVGITLNSNFYATDVFSISPSVTFFLIDGPADLTTINVDGHYNFEVGSGSTYVYPLGGLNFAVANSDSELGINLGGGVNHFFDGNLGVLGELKFVLGDADQVVLNFGVLYRL
ncbi:MAG: hypothetical protein AAGI07_08525 [Bacteroidota bacterium]